MNNRSYASGNWARAIPSSFAAYNHGHTRWDGTCSIHGRVEPILIHHLLLKGMSPRVRMAPAKFPDAEKRFSSDHLFAKQYFYCYEMMSFSGRSAPWAQILERS
jgi:hypothetical protein